MTFPEKLANRPTKDKMYRRLKSGEMILPGDENWKSGHGPWAPSWSIGCIFRSSIYWPVRRKLPAGEVALLDIPTETEE